MEDRDQYTLPAPVRIISDAGQRVLVDLVVMPLVQWRGPKYVRAREFWNPTVIYDQRTIDRLLDHKLVAVVQFQYAREYELPTRRIDSVRLTDNGRWYAATIIGQEADRREEKTTAEKATTYRLVCTARRSPVPTAGYNGYIVNLIRGSKTVNEEGSTGKIRSRSLSREES